MTIHDLTDTEDSDHLSHPHWERWAGLGIITLFFVVFLGWAAFARLDAAATASGVVVVSGDRKAIQHEAVAVVNKLYVGDGAHVAQGQILLDVEDESNAGARSALADVISLKATVARAQAMMLGRSSFTPVSADGYPEWARPLVDQANLNASSALLNAMSALATKQATLSEKAYGSRAQSAASRAQAAAAAEQSKVINGRYAELKDLYDKGLVPAPQMLELQQRKIALDGQVSSGLLQAQALDSDAAAAARESQSYTAAARSEAADQLTDAQAKLSDLEPKLHLAQSKFARSHIVSPVAGRVVNLTVHTEGGVIGAGETVMEIVPDEAPLQVEARLSPNSADQVKPGMVAQVRFAAFKDRSTPIFEGRVREVSADRLEDKRNGTPYFLLIVDLPPETLKKIRNFSNQGFDVIPGLQADVVIPIERRTALDYLVGPIRHAIWQSFREH